MAGYPASAPSATAGSTAVAAAGNGSAAGAAATAPAPTSEEAPAATIDIDLEAQHFSLPNGDMVSFEIDTFSKTCLLEGIDQLGYLMKHENQIAAFEAMRNE